MNENICREYMSSVQDYRAWTNNCMDRFQPSWTLGSRCLQENGVQKCAAMSCTADKKLLVNGSPCDPSADTTAAVLQLPVRYIPKCFEHNV
jgi:hypothetical protein